MCPLMALAFDLEFTIYCFYDDNAEYSKEELCILGVELLHADLTEFETLLNDNADLTIELFTVKRVLGTFCNGIRSLIWIEDIQTMLTKLEMLFSNEKLITKLMETYEQREPLIGYFADKFNPCDLNEITKLSCLFMMRGINIYPQDLEAVYHCYGFCELYEIMLHMDIVKTVYQSSGLEASLMPVLMFNMNYDMDICLKTPYHFVVKDSIDELVKYFALPKFKNHCLEIAGRSQIGRVENLPAVPSLVELSRNAARKFIKKEFNVKTSRQFYTVLNLLLIPKCCKDIIALKTPLYNV